MSKTSNNNFVFALLSAVVIIIIIAFVKTDLIGFRPKENIVVSDKKVVFDFAQQLKIAEATESAFIKNIFKPDQTQVVNADFYRSEETEGEITEELSQSLTNSGYKLKDDWGHQGQTASLTSSWEKGYTKVVLFLIEDIDEAAIKSLDENYNIKGVAKGSSFFVVFWTTGK